MSRRVSKGPRVRFWYTTLFPRNLKSIDDVWEDLDEAGVEKLIALLKALKEKGARKVLGVWYDRDAQILTAYVLLQYDERNDQLAIVNVI